MAFKASKTEDVISSMPEDVVTHILDRLPVQDAVKTSILSRNWRFKWTMLSQLVFDDNFFDYLTKTNGESMFWRTISRLPLNQRMILETMKIDLFSVGKGKLVLLAKLANLKILSLSLCHLDNMTITNSSSTFDLVRFLPKLQELDLDFAKCQFTEGGAEKRSLTTFPCLKTLKLSRIDLCNGIMLSCTFELIRSFPNLHTLEITTTDLVYDPIPAVCSSDVDYNTTGLLQLRSVDISPSRASANEVCLIKYLLACSPFLKRIDLRPHWSLLSDEISWFARRLLKLCRISPTAGIDLHLYEFKNST
ncbi:putative F-box domain, leucine-rich repeat domain superfamily, F-box-like domain superfamily [Helianthus annuus]|nr:putative F-box domain, leucine-rich repeat domain superfamily, F-box-like domain superfamily [Helianthus annuus]KAJ0642607.1 putative F-box domain, leucine-rich repeat domain superfamily, F-box-like domain superfamily [Helianthus annuus]KAJ0646483.1 putative F-box domain, leucine-rich repeat domain superfamily, F-box-like domain superfamily [Helianthus annuus]KAJ0823183.1 putative F-box domain, leucine-rich repeat domain superfamily, F-box-like domain superfamily [Helianthus annuus]